MSAALVTCLFDLATIDHETKRRAPSDYLPLAAPVLAIDCPMIIYTEPSLFPRIMELRGSRETYTRVVHCEDYIGGIAGRFADLFPAYRSIVNPDKDTPAYMALMHAKFRMMAEAAEADIFRTESLVWIDMAIAHAVGASEIEENLSRIAGVAPSDASVFGLAFPNEPSPPDAILLQRFWGRLCGGLFSMPRTDAVEWYDLLIAALGDALDRGDYPFECDLLYALLVWAGRLPRAENPLQAPSVPPLPPTRFYETGSNYVCALHNFSGGHHVLSREPG